MLGMIQALMERMGVALPAETTMSENHQTRGEFIGVHKVGNQIQLAEIIDDPLGLGLDLEAIVR